MIYHTLGTVLALVTSHTDTSIVIYSCISTICLVFEECWKIYNLHSKSRVYIQNLFVYEKKTTSNFVLESLNFFFMRSHSSTIIVKIIVPENKDNYRTWQHFPSKWRLYSCKMWNSFSGRK